MTIIYQKIIKRQDLRNNPRVLYLFGDNNKRCGMGGQAKEMRGEPNAIGVRTKLLPSNHPASFFSDETSKVAMQNEWITSDLAQVITHLRSGGIVVIPSDGLGSGLARLKEKAKPTWEFLNTALAKLEEHVD